MSSRTPWASKSIYDIHGLPDLLDAKRSTTDPMFVRSTTAALEDIADPINTTDKYEGKAIINNTAGTIVTAAGAAPDDVWLALDNTTAHTPV